MIILVTLREPLSECDQFNSIVAEYGFTARLLSGSQKHLVVTGTTEEARRALYNLKGTEIRYFEVARHPELAQPVE